MEIPDKNKTFEISPLKFTYFSKILAINNSNDSIKEIRSRETVQTSTYDFENSSFKENEITKDESISKLNNSRAGFSFDNIMPSPDLEFAKSGISRILSYTSNPNLFSLSSSIIPAPNRNKLKNRKSQLARNNPNSPLNTQEKSNSRESSFRDLRTLANEDPLALNFMFELGGHNETKTSTDSYIQNLDSLGLTPCACYCRICEVLVNSEISIKKDDGISGAFYNILLSTIGCCRYPDWIKKRLVHRCGGCRAILGYVHNIN